MTETPDPRVVIPTEADIAGHHLAPVIPHDPRPNLRGGNLLRHALGVGETEDGTTALDFEHLRETTRDLGSDLVLGVIRFADQVRAARGTVITQADTHDLVRALTYGEEVLTQAGQAFMRAAAECRDQVGQELVAAVGEQDGVPTGTLTVPDGGGHRIKVQAVTTKKADTWDMASIAGVVAEVAAHRATEAHPDQAVALPYATDLARQTADLLLSVLTPSSTKPSVKALNALQDELSVAGKTAEAGALEQARVKGATVWTGETKVSREVVKP